MSNKILEGLIKEKDYNLKKLLFKIVKDFDLNVNEFMLLIYFMNQDCPILDVNDIHNVTFMEPKIILQSFKALSIKGLISTKVTPVKDKISETIDLTNYTSGKNTIIWETDNVTIQQVTGQGVTQVNPNYYSPIRFYDSNILKFEGKYPAVYITKIKLTKNSKDGGGVIKPGTKTGQISGKEAVVISTRLTATKTETGWEIVSDEGFDTNTINLQYDGKIIEEYALYAVGQLQITGIEITYKHLV